MLLLGLVFKVFLACICLGILSCFVEVVSVASGLFHKIVRFVGTCIYWAFFASFLLLGLVLFVTLPLIIANDAGTLIRQYHSYDYKADPSEYPPSVNASLSECCTSSIKEAGEEISVTSILTHCGRCWIGRLVEGFSSVDGKVANITEMIRTMGGQQQQTQGDGHGEADTGSYSAGLLIVNELINLVGWSCNMAVDTIAVARSFIFSSDHSFDSFQEKTTADHDAAKSFHTFLKVLADQGGLICRPNVGAAEGEDDKECVSVDELIEGYERLSTPLRFGTSEKQQQGGKGGGRTREAKDEI